jgi:hypothetical protein
VASVKAASSKAASAKRRPRAVAAQALPSVRERILEVAERMFAEHGMSGVGLRAITTEANVNLASIAYHFGSKDGLLEALTLGVQPQFGGPAFVKLRARLGTEPETTTRKILSKAFDQSSRKFIDAIALALPQMPRAEVEWRFHFMLGAMFYTMADSGRIQALTNGRVDPGNVKRALHHMIPFLAAGFRSAPVA